MKLKRVLSGLLCVVFCLTMTAIPFGAVSYTPSDFYTVSADTPYAEEAIVACGGSLENTQTIYFQAPEEWANEYNTFIGPGDDKPYMHVCVYWWAGVGSQWQDGTKVQWVGYQAHLLDKENHIYSAVVPKGTDPEYGITPSVVWNNGVNGGSDTTAEIFQYACQTTDANIEGAEPGDYDTLPEGTPDPDSMDGCILIPRDLNSQSGEFLSYNLIGGDWYVYYGDGCYGNYATESANFLGREENCVNPEHFDENGNHIGAPILGDADGDGEVTSVDVTVIQRYDALVDTGIDEATLMNGDVDGNGELEIIDATYLQRYLAMMDVTYPIGETIG